MAKDEMTKKEICESAISLYLDNKQKLSITSLAKQIDKPRSEIYKSFSNKNSVLRYFYQDCFQQYNDQVEDISDYQDFSLEEKLSHLVYTHFELFQDEKEFVEDTFKDLIVKSSGKSKFQEMLEGRIQKILIESQGDASLIQGTFVSQFLVKELFFLIRFWLQDESENSEQTMVLTDKIISFVSELLGSQVLSKGIDLGKTLWEQDLISFKPQGLNMLAKVFLQKWS